ncbi:hypothetical protein G4H71_22185 [Rhodococcus triatomae]|uniref:DUF7716 domain-containing protein n=1 Tax=Rhodococcus triatomae TaxID=300028 RepID=A0A1G8SL59_9NOCA|nr:hypothetical protein [Rhodococcus triatomae]QNG18693.1 hypothetical protein G4H72_08190 [Rhodococcus triatomae]QNG25396.1 hypothetical protein G4H71_22185 [Rhodococcus triatomae]SDJ29982.1 hypothetical protein SAMN05444695_12228 [Rhodococcus triatomae]
MDLTLGDVLERPLDFDWRDALYMHPGEPLRWDAPCIVHDVDDVVNDERDLPEIVLAHGCEYVLGMQDVRSIVDNLRYKVPEPTAGELLEAFVFYVENDAFIVV